MNLYTAELMAQERANDRHRDFEAARSAALLKTPRAHPTGWRERASAIVAWSRVLRRGAAT